MESFSLTRKEMSSLLLSLQGNHEQTPISILQKAWSKNHEQACKEGSSLPAFLSTEVPQVVQKIIQGHKFNGFSLHEIADLGHLIEYSNSSITSIQNWVKRDFKDMFDTIKEGRKYSINQAALLFMIDDLKCNLDFLSIRKLFKALFFHDQDGQATSELMEPVQFYNAYSTMFEELDANNDQVFDIVGHTAAAKSQDSLLEKMILGHADRITQQMGQTSKAQQKVISNILVIAALSVQSSYLQSVSKRYYTATVFLDF